MNMFKPVKAKSIAAYLAALPPERRKPVGFLHRFIRKTAPKLKPNFIYNMPGYGTFTYRSYKKEMAVWPVISLASQKHYISIYVCAVQKGKYLAEAHAKDLGKVSVGRSCIRFKRLEDVNLPVLKKVIRMAARKPGLAAADGR